MSRREEGLSSIPSTRLEPAILLADIIKDLAPPGTSSGGQAAVMQELYEVTAGRAWQTMGDEKRREHRDFINGILTDKDEAMNLWFIRAVFRNIRRRYRRLSPTLKQRMILVEFGFVTRMDYQDLVQAGFVYLCPETEQKNERRYARLKAKRTAQIVAASKRRSHLATQRKAAARPPAA